MLPRPSSRISLDLAVPNTVFNLAGVPCWLVSCLDLVWVVPCAPTLSGLDLPGLDFLSLWSPLTLGLLRLALLPVHSGFSSLDTWMPPSLNQDDEVIELSFRFRQLEVTIKGPAGEASGFLSAVTSGSIAGLAPSPSPSSRSFEVISSVASPDHSGVGLRETRDQILASFSPCPGRLLALSTRLGCSQADSEGRLRRAWTAGQWAKAVLEGRCHSPNRTPPLDQRSRFYAIVKCAGIPVPVIYRSSASYWAAIKSLEGSDSISQSFPSELEAKIYVEAAGFPGEVSVLA